MALFLAAHGFDPGPTQRPWLAGAIAGLIATAPAIGLLWAFGSLRVEAQILGISPLQTLAAGAPVMAAAGAVYGRLFARAANDRRAGWLFGMAFGFALWTAGAVLILPLSSGGDIPAGLPATGLFLSLVLWGAAIGILHPFVQRPLQEDIESASRRSRVGPGVARSRRG